MTYYLVQKMTRMNYPQRFLALAAVVVVVKKRGLWLEPWPAEEEGLSLVVLGDGRHCHLKMRRKRKDSMIVVQTMVLLLLLLAYPMMVDLV
jgi:hypothetical protein